MVRLTNEQASVLANAARRDDGKMRPLPKGMMLSEDEYGKLVASLTRRGLVERIGDDANAYLAITKKGLAAINADPEEGKEATASTKPISKDTRGAKSKTAAKANAAPASAPQADGATPTARPGTKQAKVIELLRQKGGTTIAELTDATGWQAHSVRGAISGTLKKKLGLTVTSETHADRGRVYRIAEAERADG